MREHWRICGMDAPYRGVLRTWIAQANGMKNEVTSACALRSTKTSFSYHFPLQPGFPRQRRKATLDETAIKAKSTARGNASPEFYIVTHDVLSFSLSFFRMTISIY